MKQDAYERITAKIAADLEQGARPWLKPWNADHAAGRMTRPLRHNGLPYQGINVIMLWSAAAAQGYAAPIWMTFRQAKDVGAHVRKGEKGELVVYASVVTGPDTDEDSSDTVEREIPFMKGYTVFNVEQIEGLPDQLYAKPDARHDPVQRVEQADAFFAATDADIRNGGHQASYSVVADRVQMSPFETFRDAESYYATLAHECTHWTRHPKRLDRDFGAKRWGDDGYAMEELVAELGAAFLCADLEITPEVREDHASYIAGWLKVLSRDKRAIFSAAAYLHGLQASQTEERAA